MLNTLTTWLSTLPTNIGRIIIGYSGGSDSHALLHCLANILKQHNISNLKIEAWHINHGISDNANIWEQHCAQICNELHIKFQSFKTKIIKQKNHSLEEQARDARYKIFADNLQAHDILISAHHQEDQAETILMRLCRGSSQYGLSSMSKIRPLGQAQLMRPLLDISKQQINDYIIEHRLQHIHDESNSDIKFTRNAIRHNVLPKLANYFENVSQTLARSAVLCQQTVSVLNTYLAEDLAKITLSSHVIDLKKFLNYDKHKQPLLMRYWLSVNNIQAPSAIKLNEILHQVSTAKQCKNPSIFWGKYNIRRYNNALYLITGKYNNIINQAITIDWKNQNYFECANFAIKTKITTTTHNKSINLNKLNHKQITIKPRLGGEKILAHNNQHKSLKNIFQEYKIPPWQRDNVPLFYCNDELIQIGDFYLSPAWKADGPNQESLTLEINK